jgi:hypothetical protein
MTKAWTTLLMILTLAAMLFAAGCTKSQSLPKNEFFVTKVEMKEDACWITARGTNDNGVRVDVRAASKDGDCSVVGNIVWRGTEMPPNTGIVSRADQDILYDGNFKLGSIPDHAYSWKIKEEAAR